MNQPYDPTPPAESGGPDDGPPSPADGAPPPPERATSRTSSARPAPSLARRHWGKLTLAALIGAPALAFAIWAAIGLNYVYSRGERAGFVQKISRKGWLCKTWEGEMAISTIPGSMPQLFTFSVRSDSIAHAIEATNGKRIVISYEEKPWVPTSCFAETDYYVTAVRVVGSAPEPE